jgi:dissimilatory sulfite reductase (desulfoviridin) alpha/beta subunit
MAKPMHPTPNLDQLETGPWPSFVTGLKRLAKDKDYVVDVLGHLEHSYQTRKGYWKGGTVGVRGYGGGIIPRFTEIKDEAGQPVFKDAAEFHTLRVMPPPGMHYDTATLRQFCDIWDKYGSGLIALHGQSGDIMMQGCTTENVQKAWDEINEMGFDLGGAGPAVRTSMSCVGAARCEQSCYDEAKAHKAVINSFLDDIHRPALPYKFKFKFSGCGNDCMNAIQRSDMAIIGTWRDNIRTDDELGRKWFARHGMNELINDVVARCPTKALADQGCRHRAQGRTHLHRGAGRQTVPGNRQQGLRALHALHQRHDRRPGPGQGQGRLDPGRRQEPPQDRRPDGHPGRSLHEAGYRRRPREAGRTGPVHHRLLRRERTGARAHRRDDRAHWPGQLPRRHRPRRRSRT